MKIDSIKKINDLYKKSKVNWIKSIYEFCNPNNKTVKTGILLKDTLISINLNAPYKDSKKILYC